MKGDPSEEEMRVFRNEVYSRHLSREWLYMPEWRHREIGELRKVKVSGDVRVAEVDYKARKMIRVTAVVAQDHLEDVLISGDFFMVPEDALPLLEQNLRHAPIDYAQILKRVRLFYAENSVQTPGLTAEDFSKAIMKALQ